MKYIEKVNNTFERFRQAAAQKAMWAIVLELFQHVGLTTDFFEDGNFKYTAMRHHRAFAGNPGFFGKVAFRNDISFKEFELVMLGDAVFVNAFNSTFTEVEQRILYLDTLTLLTHLNYDRREALLNFLQVFSTEPNNTLFACCPDNAEFLLYLLTNPELITERSAEHD